MSGSLGGRSGVSFSVVLRSCSVALLSREALRPPALRRNTGRRPWIRNASTRRDALRMTSMVAFRSSMRLCVNVRASISRVAAQAPRLAGKFATSGARSVDAEELRTQHSVKNLLRRAFDSPVRAARCREATTGLTGHGKRFRVADVYRRGVAKRARTALNVRSGMPPSHDGDRMRSSRSIESSLRIASR